MNHPVRKAGDQASAVNPVVLSRFREVLGDIAVHTPSADQDLIRRAFYYAYDKHDGQTRKSGDPYIAHPVEVMKIVGDMRLDEASLCAALLHDTVEDTDATVEDIAERFGESVAILVEGLTKIAKIKFQSKEEHQAENIRKLIVSMSRDLRVIFVKLADRTHNIQTLGSMPAHKKERIAQETLEIYAPLANRLGINWVKGILEDESLKHLHPSAWAELKARVNQKKVERESYSVDTTRLLRELMQANEIVTEVSGRSKHFYSIWRKMERTGVDFDEIYDITAFRILVADKTECYHALGLVHEEWRPVAGRFKDYIAVPKPNGYRSLHTTVIGPRGERVEIQIRSQDMHRVAELGVAAHWAYKEGGAPENGELDSFNWIRSLVQSQAEIGDSREYLETVKLDLFDDEVFVFTPRGDIKNLPRGATPLDFAYSVHSEVGNHCVHARVNGRQVSLRYELHNGDQVEVITRDDQHPREEWLDIVKSSRARNRIRAWINAEKRQHALALGLDMLGAELRKRGERLNALRKSGQIQKAASALKVQTEDNLFTEIGFGQLKLGAVMARLFPDDAPSGAVARRRSVSDSGQLRTIGSRLRSLAGGKSEARVVHIAGIDGDFMKHFARCCNAVPGEPIVGYVTRGRGVVIHHEGCSRLDDLEEERLIEVEWEQEGTSVPSAERTRIRVRVMCRDEKGILSDMTSALTSRGVDITEAHCRSTGDGLATGTFDVLVDSIGQLGEAMKTVGRVEGVVSVQRVPT